MLDKSHMALFLTRKLICSNILPRQKGCSVMHKEYMYLNNKVVISDENGNIKKEDYHSKIFEQLQTENEIEVLEMEELKSLNIIEEAKNKIRSKIECLTPFIFGTSLSVASYFYQLYLTYSMYGETINSDQLQRLLVHTGEVSPKLVLTKIVTVFAFSSTLAVSVNRFGINNESKKDIEQENIKIKEIKQELISKKEKLQLIKETADSNKKIYKNYDVIDIKTKQFKKTR